VLKHQLGKHSSRQPIFPELLVNRTHLSCQVGSTAQNQWCEYPRAARKDEFHESHFFVRLQISLPSGMKITQSS
jgi:hypothetical protein